MSNTFQINSVSFRYAREAFNEAYKNERSMEVALGRWFLKRFPSISDEFSIGSPVDKDAGLLPPVLEVGAVMPYYGHADHEIIDLADAHPRSRKINALDADYTGRNVLCLSTIEHMMKREYNNGSDDDSITFLTRVISQASRWLVTVPIGYNPFIDAHVKGHPEIARTYVKRISWKNEWIHVRDVDAAGIWSTPFGHSDRPIPPGFFNNANAICIVTNLPELL